METNEITSNGVATLLNALAKQGIPTNKLYLNRNPIDNTCMKSVGEYIKQNKNLEEIGLSVTNISDAGIEIIAPYVCKNTTLTKIFFFGNQAMTDKSLPLFLKMIESTNIERIDLRNTAIQDVKPLLIPMIHNMIRRGCEKISFPSK